MGVIPDCGLLELIVLSIPRSALRPEVINIFHPDDAVLPERPAPLNSFLRTSVMSWASTMLIAPQRELLSLAQYLLLCAAGRCTGALA